MRAFFLPFVRGNLYQPMLADALRRENIEVETNFDLKTLVRGWQNRSECRQLIHLHWLPSAGPGFVRLARWLMFQRRLSTLSRLAAPLVWTAHNIVPHESRTPRVDLWLTRRVASMANAVICHSAAARDEMLERLRPIRVSKFKVIPHGNYIGCYPEDRTVAECRRELGLHEGDLVYLFLGQIRPYKGVLNLIDAFRQLADPSAKLVLAGKPMDVGTAGLVQSRAAGDNRIIFRPGFVADSDIQVYLKAADVVVFPYHKSLTSGALVLAMSFGRPAIAARHAGTVDILGENGGFLYETARADGLLVSLQAAGRGRTALPRMGAENRQRALAWNWPLVAADTAAVYREVTAKVTPDP